MLIIRRPSRSRTILWSIIYQGIALLTLGRFLRCHDSPGAMAFSSVVVWNHGGRTAQGTSSSSSSSSSPSVLSAFLDGRRMLTDLRSRFLRALPPEKSADIYMNPATKKIAEIAVSWEPDAATTILKMAQERPDDAPPLLVGVVGIPGSGKSTSCEILADLLPDAMVMPMDGYHYSLEQLRQMEDPEDKVYRRGAPDTFDPFQLKKDLRRIVHGDESTVPIPGFDHAVGDPQPDQHTFVRGKHKIVICEGIYLLHDSDGWEDVKEMLDYGIFIRASIDTCVDRLKERNKCIPGYTADEIEIRCEVVDRRNAELSQHSQKFADLVVNSGAIGTEELCDVED